MKFLRRILQMVKCHFDKHEMSFYRLNETIKIYVEYKCNHCDFKDKRYSHEDIYTARKIQADFSREHIATRFVLFEKDRKYLRLTFLKSLQYIVESFENNRTYRNL